MPRLKKTEAQRRAEIFRYNYKIGKARIDLLDPQIAAAVGIGASTLSKYKKEPERFTVPQLARLGQVLGWSDDEYLEIIKAQKIRP